MRVCVFISYAFVRSCVHACVCFYAFGPTAYCRRPPSRYRPNSQCLVIVFLVLYSAKSAPKLTILLAFGQIASLVRHIASKLSLNRLSLVWHIASNQAYSFIGI
jgi:hypothetical protein